MLFLSVARRVHFPVKRSLQFKGFFLGWGNVGLLRTFILCTRLACVILRFSAALLIREDAFVRRRGIIFRQGPRLGGSQILGRIGR